jgi:hypothetical protein
VEHGVQVCPCEPTTCGVPRSITMGARFNACSSLVAVSRTRESQSAISQLLLPSPPTFMMKIVTTYSGPPRRSGFRVGWKPILPDCNSGDSPGLGSAGPAEPKPAFTLKARASTRECSGVRILQYFECLVGCSNWPDRSNFPFDPRDGEHALTPAILSLDGYEVDESEWDSCRYRFSHF